MRKPEDTSKISPETHLVDAITVGASNSIELSESMGQSQMVRSTVIPTDGAEDLAALGFTLGEVVKDDPIFRECSLPPGWQREGSDHSMWSYIVDERGFRRVAIFYKAAFYDRSAHVRIVSDPQTRAQAETYESFSGWCSWPGWDVEPDQKDGDNLVRSAREMDLDSDGKPVYDHDNSDWKVTGRVRRRVIAPDGSLVSESDSG